MYRIAALCYLLVFARGSWDKQVGVFISNSTDFDDELRQMQALLQVKPGMTYCEMGAANGKFMVLLGANAMPGGKVIATDAASGSIPVLEKAAREAGLRASVVLATDLGTGFPAGACDVIMSRMVYHMIKEDVAVKIYLPQLKQALKPDGKMLILDHDPNDGATTRANASLIMHHGSMVHSMNVVPRLQEIREFTSAGFALVDMLEWPWFGSTQQGFALLWVHPRRKSGSNTAKNMQSIEQSILAKLDNVLKVGMAGIMLVAICAAMTCCVLRLGVNILRKLSALSSGRAKVATNEDDHDLSIIGERYM
eukprot:TRINITY_DN37765_c0_g1_i1.p1 TRINITY_DN37765_c0_g1~~TRINITY_DN37765_c0_g1_i1.p1  ORF type:complete len:309 (-),score=30.74 TRINITY_DN37765_c0_g1_i1:287-1213(-)